jgi:methionine synthase I (cobalamin-dependent)
MTGLIEELAAKGPILTDGAWGTQLQARGLPPGAFPDAWNLSHADQVEEVGCAYVDAGSQIILTNTFGANRIRLAEFGLEKDLSEINRAGVAVSRSATRGHALVFASIGPTGKLLIDSDFSADRIRAAFEEQAEILADAGADALVIETMTDLEEAILAVTAARATGLPVIACMVFDSGKDKQCSMMGNTPEDSARALNDAGADAIGANCGQAIEGYAAICRRLRAATELPIWLKPNAGLPVLVNGRAEYHATAADFAAQAPALIASGATFLGGCCGTSPAFIQATQSVLAARQRSHAPE